MTFSGVEISVIAVLAVLFTAVLFRIYKAHLIAKLEIARCDLEYEVNKRTRLLGQAIDELMLQKTQLNLITDSLPVLVAYFDRNIILKFHNKVYRQWLSLKDDESVLGLHLSQIVPPEVYDIVISRIQQALAGETVSFESIIPYKDRIRTLNLNYIPDKDRDGTVRGYVVLATDIGQYKEVETNLTKAKEQAESASHAKTTFLANMSHEIRTPLGAMMGFTELLRVNSLEDGPNKEYIEAIRRNGSLLSKVINNILDLSKIEAGHLELESAEIPLSEVMTDINSLLSLKAQEKGIELSISQSEDAPSMILTDPLRLRQVLTNVVNNAVKFTNRGAVHVRVECDQHHPELLAFTVRDTGIGMSNEQSRKIFEPFQQADASLTRKFGGTGLGLVLAKKLAQRLGGDVLLIKTEEGIGSEFRIVIDPGPVKRAAKKRPALELNHSLKLERQLTGMNILLVDDAPDNRTMMRLFIEMAGAIVDVACDGQDGVNKATAKMYDVILMDLQMPTMDGYEATAILRRQGFRGPIIAVTAHVFKEELQHCLKVGFDGHLSKPVEWQALIETIAQFRTWPILASPSEFQRCE